jgi:hypothetical protein
MPGLKRQPILWVQYVFRAFRLNLVAYLQYEAFKSLLAEFPFWARTKLHKQVTQETATPVYYAIHCSKLRIRKTKDS